MNIDKLIKNMNNTSQILLRHYESSSKEYRDFKYLYDELATIIKNEGDKL